SGTRCDNPQPMPRELAFDLPTVCRGGLVGARNQPQCRRPAGGLGEARRALVDLAPDGIRHRPALEEAGSHAQAASNLPRSASGVTWRAWIIWMMRVCILMSPMRHPPTSPPSLNN